MNFSDSLLELIFQNLSENELKILLEIESFRRVILRSTKLMRKLTLQLFGLDWKFKVDFVRQYGENIMNVNFCQAGIRSFSEVKSVLSYTRNMEKLTFYPYIMSFDCDDSNTVENIMSTSKLLEFKNEETFCEFEDDKPTFHRLNFLEVTAFESIIFEEFFQFIWDCDRLLDFHLTFLHGRLPKIVIDFIFKQENLKTLSISHYNSFFSIPISRATIKNAKFRIKKLIMNFSIEFSEILEEFCKTQTEVEFLEIFSFEIDGKALQQLLKSFRKLKTFNCYIYNDLGDSIISGIFVNSLEELNLRYAIEDPVLFEKFLKIFPNLRKFEMREMKKFHLTALSNFSKLTELIVCDFQLISLFNVSMPSLKRLKMILLNCNATSEVWENLAACNPNLESLVIDDFQISASTKEDVSVVLKNLRNFEKLKNFFLETKIVERTMNRFEQMEEFLYKVEVSVKKISNEKTEIEVSSCFVDNFFEDLLELQGLFPQADITIV